MDAHIHGGIEGIFDNPHVRGYEATIKHQIILEQGGLHFPLSNYFKHYDSGPIYGIAKMSSYY
jgi:hypothetical protein